MTRQTPDAPAPGAQVQVILAVCLGLVLSLVTESFARASTPEGGEGLFEIVATDQGFEHPEAIPAVPTHLVFENRGSTIHEAMFIRLPEGMTGEDYLAAVRGGAAFPEGALDHSGPGLTSPGGRVEMWLYLDPGTYLLGCWFRGHLKATPAHTVEVVATSEPRRVRPPKADVAIRMSAFRFDVEGTLKPGSQVLRIETPGPSMHEMDIFRLLEGKTLRDLRAWQRSGKKGPAPAVAVGGVLDQHDLRRTVWLRTRFQPGRYVLWCNMSLAPDGSGTVTHAESGMVKELVVEELPAEPGRLRQEPKGSLR